MRTIVKTILLITLIATSGCVSLPDKKSTDDGKYYSTDRPPTKFRDISKIPDAVPIFEPLSRSGNSPYKALGKKYYPIKSAKGFKETGIASWYGTKYHGRTTSSGEIYDMWKMTAAHPTLPLPTYVWVENLENGKQVIVKVNDRGPFLGGRVIDLSYVAAHKLDIANKGLGRVSVTAIDPESFNNTSYSGESVPILKADVSNIQEPNRGYLIQVGAFSKSDNALLLKEKLTRSGYTLIEEAENSELQELNRVRVGPYLSEDEAWKVQSEIDQTFNVQSILIESW